MLHPRHAEERRDDPSIPPKGDSRPIKNLPIELLSRILQFGVEDSLHGNTQDLTTDDALEEPSRFGLENVDSGVVESEITTENEADERTGDAKVSDDARLPRSFPIIVSHVSRHWRNAAISTASLWTNITISPVSRPPYQRIAAFLERSKCLPIDIRVRLGPQQPRIHLKLESPLRIADVQLLYDLLVTHVDRWRSVDVRAVSHQQMFAFLNAVSDPTITVAPQLVSLVLSANQAIDHDEGFQSLIVANSFSPFGGSAPLLERISLQRVFVDWNQDWISYASRLTTLELKGHAEDMSPSWEEFATILDGAPALERLVLHGSGPPGVPPNWDVDPGLGVVVTSDPNPIQLLNLKHLSLLVQSRVCVYGLLLSLYMPALRSLTIDFFWDDYTELLAYITAPATIPATLSIEEPPQSLLHNLETLDINCLFCVTEVVELLYDELENIRSLKISMDDFWYAHSGCALILPLLPLAENSDDAVNLRLPRLETLSISHVSTFLHFQVIRKVVQQRSDAGIPIKSLYVESTYDMDEEDAVWFGENLETFVFSRQPAKL